jgi:hypothetical protein
MNASGTALVYSTYLPHYSPNYSSYGHAIAVNPDGSVFLSQDAQQQLNVAPLNVTGLIPNGSAILWISNDATSILGSQFIADISVSGIWMDATGVLIAGQTGPGAAVATPGAYQTSLKGPVAGSVSKIDFAPAKLPTLNINAQSLIFNLFPSPIAPITLSLTSTGADSLSSGEFDLQHRPRGSRIYALVFGDGRCHAGANCRYTRQLWNR